MPKVQSPNIEGSLCSSPEDHVVNNYNIFSRPADSYWLIIVKIKRKLSFKGHVITELERVCFVKKCFLHLKK